MHHMSVRSYCSMYNSPLKVTCLVIDWAFVLSTPAAFRGRVKSLNFVEKTPVKNLAFDTFTQVKYKAFFPVNSKQSKTGVLKVNKQ